MKKLLPVIIAFLGLGAGIGAGVMLKPAPEEAMAAVTCPAAEAAGETAAGHGDDPAADHGAGHGVAHGEAAADCESGAEDPFQPVAHDEKQKPHDLAYVPIEKSFVVPVFAGEKIKAMVVLSLSVETETEVAPEVEGLQPRLRDSFLKVLFRHANSGGFDGSFTTGRKMDDLKSALLRSAREVMGEVPVEEVLITEIARQDT